MQGAQIGRFATTVALALLLAATSAHAGNIRYSWSGRLEPIGSNPWGLSGDGSALTPDDGTPFSIQGYVDEDAIDEDGTNPDQAQFAPITAVLLVDQQAAILSFPRFLFVDDEFDGALDMLQFNAHADLLGTSLDFTTNVRLPASTFDLLSPGAVDLPPSFSDTILIQTSGVASDDLLVLSDETPVTGHVVPEASGSAGCAVAALALFARRLRSA